MNRRAAQSVQFSQWADCLGAENVWEYDHISKLACTDVAGQTHHALQNPIDFPPMESAIVPGDRVALAVDPNLPQLCDVVHGVVKTIGQTEAGEIDIVLWDEADDETIGALRDTVGDSANVIRHDSSHRESVRYFGADKDALPIYINRAIVDADFVLPVVSVRPLDTLRDQDLTGIFPALVDSSTRARHRSRTLNATCEMAADVDHGASEEAQVAWLLGVQLILAVVANADSEVSELFAGTRDAFRQKVSAAAGGSATAQRAELVVASLDGDSQQQTWFNAARGIVAASRYVEPRGTIVLWSRIATPPPGLLANLGDHDLSDGWDHKRAEGGVENEREDTGDFEPWDDSIALASAIARIASEHRILIHTELDRDMIEPIGLGAIDDAQQLHQLSGAFRSCGVLRSAQFAGSTLADENRMGLQQ